MEAKTKEASRQTQTGYIKAIISRKGYGFIASNNGSDLFFHKAGIVQPIFEELREGMPVEFIAVGGKKGPKAIGIVTK